ncbi:hypothetical protein O6H91_08G106600 [Diphasiastrum complanatum]|uniref:Uncharacterized protein n=1 Tax=Diphasiastrum complanatum TaxID=34168 RepID=A0ACC2D0K8_DIPCM|nr:hypothetical protein O6H91_08G106600 [Diphasiastrum complanatum]
MAISLPGVCLPSSIQPFSFHLPRSSSQMIQYGFHSSLMRKARYQPHSPSFRFRTHRKYGTCHQNVLREDKSMGIRCEASSSTVSATPAMDWVQKTIELPEFRRGCHIITKRIYSAVPEIKQYEVGIAHLFVLHTSASLTINENASPDVPLDMEDTLSKIVPEGRHYRHLDEGLDDMPAHVKASLMGSSLSIPITAGRFNLGVWQGIWLNEHRDYGGPRRVCVTMYGKKRPDQRAYC